MSRFVLLALALVFSLQAQAEPASVASVEKALALIHAEQSLAAIWGPVEANMRQTIAKSHGDKPATPEQRASEDRLVKRALAMMHEQLNWKTLEPQYVKLYTETFSQQEIDGLIAFYSSPAGQAYLAKMPLLMQHSMQLMQAQMQDMMPKIMQILHEPAPTGAPDAPSH